MSDEWQPIDSAPMDGTEILAARGKLQCVVSHRAWRRGDGCWETNAITWRSDSGYHMTPTHWRPLPSPPSEEEHPNA